MMEEFHYRLGWRSRGYQPGAHRGTQAGAGYEFKGHRSLADGADPRRLDIRASLRDPFQRWQVREFDQRSAVPVVVLADLSSSMAVQGRTDRWQTLMRITAATAWSATRNNDLFSFIGCDHAVRQDLYVPPTARRAAAMAVVDRLAAARPSGATDGAGLLQAPAWLPQRRSLVLLVSDFHHPLERLGTLLDSLRTHDVVPVVVWDPVEAQVPSGRGLLRLQDSETGRHRLVWLRPALRARWAAALQARRTALLELCEHHGRRPLVLEEEFDADRFTDYFHAAA